MGWETRNGRKYYYRKVRECGKVRSVYVGNDPAQAWYAVGGVATVATGPSHGVRVAGEARWD